MLCATKDVGREKGGLEDEAELPKDAEGEAEGMLSQEHWRVNTNINPGLKEGVEAISTIPSFDKTLWVAPLLHLDPFTITSLHGRQHNQTPA